MSGLHLPPAEPPDDAISTLRAQLAAARVELHEAQQFAARLDVDTWPATGDDAVAVARGVIERDLAARRVEAWSSVLDRIRAQARAQGLFE